MCRLCILALVSIFLVFVGAHSMQTNTADQQLVIILMGPPGSGKGTQAKDISEEKKLPHISTGDLFRENIKQDTALGKKAKEFINQGQLVPDSLVLDMLFQRVSQEDCKRGYLLDGFPRTLAQAEALDKALPKNTHLIAIQLHVSDDAIIQRITGRLSCKACGHVHHKLFNPPQKADTCDRCGGSLYQRDDDTLEVIAERLKGYKKQTAPLIDYYRAKKVLFEVDGERDLGAVKKQIMEILQTQVKG